MQDSDGDGVQEAINVSFTFIQNGKMMRLNIPLLSIVPIPYIAIQNVDIAFKANINASASTGDDTTTNNEFSTEASGGINRLGWGLFGIKIDMKGSVSSKRDSRATQDSKYSVEYTMDIGIHAGQDSMPGGLAKVLEIMNNCITLTEPEGTLGVNDHYFVIIENDEDKKHAQLIATYKSPEGLYQPAAIVLHSDSETGSTVDETVISGNSKVYAIDKPGTYVLTAGQLKETIVVKSAGETPAKEAQTPQTQEA